MEKNLDADKNIGNEERYDFDPPHDESWIIKPCWLLIFAFDGLIGFPLCFFLIARPEANEQSRKNILQNVGGEKKDDETERKEDCGRECPRRCLEEPRNGGSRESKFFTICG